MNVLNAMKVFAEVAKQQGFAPAARALSLSTSAVSRQVMDLEHWLGVELFQRTTRKLAITEEGHQYLARCQHIIEEVDQIKNLASEVASQPMGTLRLTAPAFLAKDWLQHLIPDFLTRYPHVSVSLTAIDRFVDFVDEGYDLALRIAELPDSTLIARRLMDVDLVCVASPDYLKNNGEPDVASDLKQHNCIVDISASFENRWPMKQENKSIVVPVKGNLSVNGGEIARNMAIAGVGLTLLPRIFVLEELYNNQLVSVLEGQIGKEAGLYAVYPQSRHLSPKVRCFIDHAVAHIEQLKLRYQAR